MNAKSVLRISVNLLTLLLILLVVGCSRPYHGAPPHYEIAELTALAEPDVTATPIMVSVTPTPYLDYWVPYTQTAFAVSIEFPVSWSADLDYVDEELGPLRISGDNGYVAFSAMNGESLDEVVNREAHHKIKPYGSQPSVDTVELNGQTWQLIMPSVDQSPDMAYQAAMITAYPERVTISGSTYRYFVLWADYPHIRTLAQTVRFLSVN